MKRLLCWIRGHDWMPFREMQPDELIFFVRSGWWCTRCGLERED
jgi:hypothetical protein